MGMTVHNPTLSVGGTFDTPTLSGALYHQSTFNNLFIEGLSVTDVYKRQLMTSIEITIAQNKEGRALVPEVCIFFENHLMRGNRTTKMNAENFNAFRSFNYQIKI